jgi:hypothetical protein
MFIPIPENVDMFQLLAENNKLVKKEAEKFGKWLELFKPGTKYAKVNQEENTIIYGIILDPLEGLTDPDEIEYTRELYESSPEMRFVRAFSNCCDEGEMGDEWPQTVQFIITDEDFELAKRLGWPSKKIQSQDRDKIKFVLDYIDVQE